MVTSPRVQLVLVDTPSLHRPKDRLGARLVEDARSAAGDADVILWVVDSAAAPTRDDELAASTLQGVQAPIVLALNKSDRLRGAARSTAPQIEGMPPVTAAAAVSAATGAGAPELIDILVPLLPAGPPLFPPEMFTDRQEQQLVGEFIREQAMLLTREEVPHGIAVEIEEFTPREGEALVYIRATVLVERDAHRKIVIGAGGRLLREIGRRARRDIESLLASRAYLDLWVKVVKDWRNKDAVIERLYPRS